MILARAIFRSCWGFERMSARAFVIARVSGEGLNRQKKRMSGLPDEIRKVWVSKEMANKKRLIYTLPEIFC